MKVLLAVLLLVLLASPCFAGWQDNIVDFIKLHEAKTGVFYDLKDFETREFVGTNLYQDLLIDNLDVSLNWDFDKAILLGLDYTVKANYALEPFVGFGVGLDRIEDLENDLGEFLVGVSCGVRF